MKNLWNFATPKSLIVQAGVISNVPEMIEELGINKLYAVIDPNLLDKNIEVKHIAEKLQETGAYIFSEFTTNPTTDQVNNSVQKYLEFQPNGVIVIGGGSAIDLTKSTILVSENGGIIEDYLGGKKGDKQFPTFVAIPTTCGTGSEASPYAVILDPQTKKKRGIENPNFLPRLVILDQNLLSSLDTTTLVSTSTDALSHILESFISKKANEITRSSARGLLLGLKNNIEKSSVGDINASGSLLNAAFSSRLLYPRTGLTIAHGLSHPLGAYTNIHHGAAVCFFLPISLKENQSFCNAELSEALDILGFENLEIFLKWFRGVCDRSGITSYIQNFLNEMPLPVEIMARDAMESSNIQSNPKPVKQSDLVDVIMKSCYYWGIK